MIHSQHLSQQSAGRPLCGSNVQSAYSGGARALVHCWLISSSDRHLTRAIHNAGCLNSACSEGHLISVCRCKRRQRKRFALRARHTACGRAPKPGWNHSRASARHASARSLAGGAIAHRAGFSNGLRSNAALLNRKLLIQRLCSSLHVKLRRTKQQFLRWLAARDRVKTYKKEWEHLERE